MISLVICSAHKKISKALVNNITESIGVQHEIVYIDNHDNRHSIFSAYNEGVARCRYPYLCFIHEDVFFHSHNWGKKIINHLQVPNVGICGLAGRDFVTRVPASWRVKLPSVNIIQSDHSGRKSSKKRLNPPQYKLERRNVVLLDGVMLCMKKEIFNHIRFDDQLEGFHGYDFDICIQAAVNGFDNYVMYDIEVEHFSRGNPDAEYYRILIKVFRKWSNLLPLTLKNAPNEQIKQLPAIEKKGVSRLLGKLVRREFPTNEIVAEISYFINSIDLDNKQTRLKTILPEVYAQKLIYFTVNKIPKRFLCLVKGVLKQST